MDGRNVCFKQLRGESSNQFIDNDEVAVGSGTGNDCEALLDSPVQEVLLLFGFLWSELAEEGLHLRSLHEDSSRTLLDFV